jgi:inosose dehydratase
MAELGFSATELGPDGWIASSPSKAADAAEKVGLELVGGFLGERLHSREHGTVIQALAKRMEYLLAANAPVFVLAADSGGEGSYSAGRARMDRDDWNRVGKVCERLVDEVEARPGIIVAVHPHLGTAVETRDDVLRLSERLSAVGHPRLGLCLDTGHLVLGGMDPVELVNEVPELIHHVHLKDLGEIAAGRVRDGGMPYVDAVRTGLNTPIGHGDIQLEDVIGPLMKRGYDGWWVLEQDRFPNPVRAREDAMESLLVARELLGASGGLSIG